MKFEEYRDLHVQLLHLDEDFETIELPVEINEGELPEEALIRFLASQNLIEIEGEVFRIPDREKIVALNPSIMKLLDAVMLASAYAELDELADKGLVYMTADDEGNICYELTDLGREQFKD